MGPQPGDERRPKAKVLPRPECVGDPELNGPGRVTTKLREDGLESGPNGVHAWTCVEEPEELVTGLPPSTLGQHPYRRDDPEGGEDQVPACLCKPGVEIEGERRGTDEKRLSVLRWNLFPWRWKTPGVLLRGRLHREKKGKSKNADSTKSLRVHAALPRQAGLSQW